uniref:Uncharacterized protein n=1 Tax=Cannabis sativa TaxID=3483 RepID=A0A803QIV6_CANSA
MAFKLLSKIPDSSDFLHRCQESITVVRHPLPLPCLHRKNVKEFRHRFFFSSGLKAFERPDLLTEWVRIPPMHYTTPTQLFLNHAQTQSVDDFNLSIVICPKARNPRSGKALRADIISSAEAMLARTHSPELEVPEPPRAMATSGGPTEETEALKKWLREAQDGPFRGEYTGEIWELNLDPMTDRVKRFLGPNLGPFASELGFTVSELGAMDGVMRKLRESEDMMETLRNDTDSETTVSMSFELKELHEFREWTQKEAAKAGRDALFAPVICKNYEKRFEDGVFMCWKSNKFEPRLHFLPDPETTVAQFLEKNKKLEQVLAEQRGPHLPAKAN